jgi:glycosyltransferase involved in cell wall biosynthesis
MTIGIDFSVLQGPHRYRGIGAVLRNIINSLSPEAKQAHQFVFFVASGSSQNADLLADINLDELHYSIIEFKPAKLLTIQLPGRMRLIVSAINQCKKIFDLRFGDPRISKNDAKQLDAYLQIDPGNPLPKKRRNLITVLMLHDLIPYILEWDYLWSYSTARAYSFSRKAALRVQARRYMYAVKYKAIIKNSSLLIANSKHTKTDFVRYFNVAEKDIYVILLGVNMPATTLAESAPTTRYARSSWGYLKEHYTFDQTPFLLFVGGVDKRRKLQDVVTAFNRLRAQGVAIKLVLSGDSMTGPMSVATEEIQYALRTSSYLEDIIFMGYADPSTLRWLYNHALAFVFPSKYEGFGLPVLEAMSYGTPVIAYHNAATAEIAGDLPYYAGDAVGTEIVIRKILANPNKDLRAASIKHAASFTWTKSSQQVIETIIAAQPKQ